MMMIMMMTVTSPQASSALFTPLMEHHVASSIICQRIASCLMWCQRIHEPFTRPSPFSAWPPYTALHLCHMPSAWKWCWMEASLAALGRVRHKSLQISWGLWRHGKRWEWTGLLSQSPSGICSLQNQKLIHIWNFIHHAQPTLGRISQKKKTSLFSLQPSTVHPRLAT